MITAQLKTGNFLGRVRAWSETRRVTTRTQSAAIGAHAFTSFLVKAARRDTNRYVRGWALANNMAGLPSIPVPQIVPSKYAETYLKILGDQVDTFSMRAAQLDRLIEDRFRRTGRPMRGVYYRELSGKLERTLVRLEKAREELRKAARRHELKIPDYLFMGLYNKGGIYTPIKGVNSKGKTARQLVSIRTKVYGGDGRMVVTDTATIFQLHNREPHATLVEHRWGYVWVALRFARSTGIRQMGKRYVSGMEFALGLKPMGGRNE